MFYLNFRAASSNPFSLNFLEYFTLMCIFKSDCGHSLGSCYDLIGCFCFQIQLHMNFFLNSEQLDVSLKNLGIN